MELEFKYKLLKKEVTAWVSVEVFKYFKNSHLGMLKTATLLKWASFHRSTFYYKRCEDKRGRKPSQTNITDSGEVVDDSQVVELIQELLKGEFCCYGYNKSHYCLKESGCRINHKKVYRLMKEQKLLYDSKLCNLTVARIFVNYRRIEASRPYEYLCMDISTSMSTETGATPFC